MQKIVMLVNSFVPWALYVYITYKFWFTDMRVLKEYENSSNFVFLSLRNTYTHWFLIHSFIYNTRQYQRIAKTCFSLSMLDGFLKFKKEIRGFG